MRCLLANIAFKMMPYRLVLKPKVGSKRVIKVASYTNKLLLY